MKVAVCLDDKNGMMFAKRRQSKDRVLRQEFLNYIGEAKLWMNAYSARQFAEAKDRITVDEDFLQKAAEADWCFVENADLRDAVEHITELAIYRWNRVYPSDQTFPEELFAPCWNLISRRDFAGNSHETITEEIYTL